MNRPIHFIFTFFVYVLPILMIILPFNTSAAIIDIDDIVSSKHNAKFNHKLHTTAHHLHSDWTNCGNNNDKGKIKYLDILPDPLIKGKKAIIKYDFSSLETITGGVIKVDVKLRDVSIYHKQFPICNKHTKCPIKKGNYNSSQTVTIPSYAPSGEYSISFPSRKYFTYSRFASIISGIILLDVFTYSGMLNKISGGLLSGNIVVNFAATETASVSFEPSNNVE